MRSYVFRLLSLAIEGTTLSLSLAERGASYLPITNGTRYLTNLLDGLSS